MPRIDKTDVQRLRERVDFHALVSGVTELSAAAGPGEYLGLCPFHEDRRASLSVNVDRGVYHCFACDAGGDVVDFTMNVRGCSFREAIEFLAEFAGEHACEPVGERRKLAPARERAMVSDPRLLDLLERATKRYHWSLAISDAGEAARDYLAARGVAPDVAELFRLGFSPGDSRFLHRGAVKAGFSAGELIAAGMAGPGPKGALRDHFRSPRLLFPISDAKGQVRGFSGRAIDGGEPKYFNCRTSSIFIKGQMLFGFDQARPAIKAAGKVIVSEGFFDAVALSAHGFPESVSVMGIAMTESQAAQLAALKVPVFVAYDADEGGTRTVPRALERLAAAGADDVFVVNLPAGEDPASLLQSAGASGFTRALEAARPAGEEAGDGN